jgi:DNA-binding transcriptional LysR family regulator
MSDRLLALRLFVRVARTGSFSRAGRESGLSQPSASRIVAELEREVGAALLMRTTRAVSLTEAGSDYLSHIEPLLVGLDEADHAARGTGELRGVLRVELSSSFGTREVIPRLPAFMQRHPLLRIDLSINDRHQDLVRGGVDVALRFGVLADSTATAKWLGTQPRILVASPDYLRQASAPQTPADLANHSIIVGPADDSSTIWSFRGDGQPVSIRVRGRITATSNDGAIAAAACGLGIVSTVQWGCRAELKSQALVRVLEGYLMEEVDLHAVFPAGRAAKTSARALVDYLASTLCESFADSKSKERKRTKRRMAIPPA